MNILLAIWFTFLIVSLVYLMFKLLFGINYSVHKEVTKNDCLKYGKADFLKFKEYFDNVEWTFNETYRESLFSEDGSSSCHASIIEFNGNAMLMKNFIEYQKAQRYIKKYINTNFKKNVEW